MSRPPTQGIALSRVRPTAAISLVLLACSPAPLPTPKAAPSAAPMGPPSSAFRHYDAPLGDADRARQALNRLTFGARPNDLAAVERMGVRAWVELQLNPERVPDPAADSVLDRLPVIHKSAFEIVAEYPAPNDVGLAFPPFSPDTAIRRPRVTGSAMAELADLRAQVDEQNALGARVAMLGQQSNAVRSELIPSVLLRATLSDRQLLEVMTVFWENHFSVSADKMPTPYALIDYDHAIHDHALGKFRDLLKAVESTPAMLNYLDAAQSTVDSLHVNPMEMRIEALRMAHPPYGDTAFARVTSHRQSGINENFARELMELHTLGVDGGYSQHDVQEVARCFTGWGIDNQNLGGLFAFHADQHDVEAKVVLGARIPAGRGVEDGEQVLDILARHPSTARFIAKKLVTHFVSDDPPPALVDRAAQTFMRTDGDIREVMRTIILSPEFNSRAAYRSKAKTPFELIASVLRAMNAAPDTTQRTVQLVADLGQRTFGHVTPEGWPDQGAAWLNMGALLDRVNFAVRVGKDSVPNITIKAWRPAAALLTLSAEAQIDGVVAALLSDDASPQTRQGLREIDSPSGTFRHIGELVALVIGSADFQSR